MSTGGPHRPRLHFTPPVGWLNDPNGLVFHDGEYHLFYQHHPDSDVWGPMHWGHAVSRDLIGWEHLPIALAPDDRGWIYSGSAVVDHHGTARSGRGALVAVFTHASAEGQSQSLAWSRDRGRTWHPFEGNPVLRAPHAEPDFRDPKVFRWDGRDPGAGHWVMVLAAGRRVLFYRSADLRTWEPASELWPAVPGEVVTWETPDLFRLRVQGTDEYRWVLSLAAMNGAPGGGGGTCYLIGDFDGRVFTSDGSGLVWADHGPDFYAAQAWNDHPDGARVWVAWLGNWAYAEQVPSSGWRGVMSLPRELGLVRVADGLRLTQQPVAALDRSLEPLFSLGPVKVNGTTTGAEAAVLRDRRAECFDLVVTFEVDAGTPATFEIRIVSGPDEWTSIVYDAEDGAITLDRSHSGAHPFHREHPSVFRAPLQPVDGVVTLRVVGDTCSMEVFGNGGLVSLSALVFPSRPGYSFEFRALRAPAGSVTCPDLRAFGLLPTTCVDEHPNAG